MSNVKLGSSNAAPDGHILTGTLECEQCAASYPIVRGIPRFAGSITDSKVQSTIEAFGDQWKQANDLVLNTRLSVEELFLDFIKPVEKEHFARKIVLDGGCGQGRFTLLAQRFGAEAVVGVDLSDAVELAFENTRNLPNVLIIQADLLNLPLKPHFDYAFSVGVLHHTSAPSRAFASIASCLNPTGSISAWVYGRENNGWIIYLLNPIRIFITSRLPRSIMRMIAYVLALPMYVLIKGIYLPISRSSRLKGLGKYLFYFDYLCWLGKYCGFYEQALVIIDHLGPGIAEYITHGDFSRWFQDNHLERVTITSRANNSWRGFGVKSGAL